MYHIEVLAQQFKYIIDDSLNGEFSQFLEQL